jgi:hypothetical protein
MALSPGPAGLHSGRLQIYRFVKRIRRRLMRAYGFPLGNCLFGKWLHCLRRTLRMSSFTDFGSTLTLR